MPLLQDKREIKTHASSEMQVYPKVSLVCSELLSCDWGGQVAMEKVICTYSAFVPPSRKEYLSVESEKITKPLVNVFSFAIYRLEWRFKQDESQTRKEFVHNVTRTLK